MSWRWGRSRGLLVMSLTTVVSSTAVGQAEQAAPSRGVREGTPAAPSPLTSEQQKKQIGPPQVIEIPLPAALSSQPLAPGQDVMEHGRADEPAVSLSQTIPSSRAGYLGVLYATAEEGPAGVRVLGVVEGSPAERAGFSASPPPPPRKAQILKAALILLALSPVGPLAIPLVIAHEAYYHQLLDQGDLITAVAGQPVRDAHEFNDVMRRFGPGDTVTFSVQRGTTSLQLSAQLEAEP